MNLIFNVKHQIITFDKTMFKVVEKSKNYLHARFEFTDDWDDVTKTAVFVSAKGEAYNVLLINDECLVPWEVIDRPYFTVSVFGGDLITTNKISVYVLTSGYVEGEIPGEPTPDIYAQILEMAKGPYIGANGNWYVWDVYVDSYVDSGVSAVGGSGGGSGGNVTITSGDNGYIVVNGRNVQAYNDDELREQIEVVDEQTKIIKSDVEGMQEKINNEAHFRGYLSTNAKIQAMEATPNDFAYSAESCTKWIYDDVEGWQDTGVPVPDQLTPASETPPLMNGKASVGTEEAYARGDHRHPTDTTRVGFTDYATNEKAGVVKVGNAGVKITEDGFLVVSNEIFQHIEDAYIHIQLGDRENWNNKIDNPSIERKIYNDTLILHHNQEAYLPSITNLIIALPIDVYSQPFYHSCFGFVAGDTISLNYAAEPIIWRGDDCDSEGDFVPQPNKTYEVALKKVNEKLEGNDNVCWVVKSEISGISAPAGNLFITANSEPDGNIYYNGNTYNASYLLANGAYYYEGEELKEIEIYGWQIPEIESFAVIVSIEQYPDIKDGETLIYGLAEACPIIVARVGIV